MVETLHANNTLAYLLSACDTDDTNIVLMTGQGAQFPAIAPGGEQQFFVTVEDRTRGLLEIMLCTSRSVDSLTVVRARQGTTATAFLAGTTVSNRVTAEFLNGIDARVAEAESSAGAAEEAAAAALLAADNAAGAVDDAVQAANDATAAANAASGKADDAQADADQALINAGIADGKAVTAQTRADEAWTKGNQASIDAAAATTAANTATGNAGTALSTAQDAQIDADAALVNAGIADGKAVTAQNRADEAWGKADSAQTTANAASVAAGGATTAANAATLAANDATLAAEAAVQWGAGVDKTENRALITTGGNDVDTVPTSVVVPVADRLYGTQPAGPATALLDFPYVLKRLFLEKVVKVVSGGNFGAIVIDGTESLLRFNLTANGVFNAAITGMRPGLPLLARFRQDATGGRTLTSTTAAVAEWQTGDFSIRTGPNLDTFALLIPLENGNVKVKQFGWPMAN